MRAKYFFLFCCFLIIFGSGCTGNKIYENRVIIEEVKVNSLEPEPKKWASEKKDVGVYVYKLGSSEGDKEGSIYLICSIKVSSYERQVASGMVEKKLLSINIDYKMAENDHLVNSKYIFKVYLKNKPEKIEIYRNGQKVNWGV